MSSKSNSQSTGNLTYFHVGLPKCASTTLQKHLFCKLDKIQNFGLYPTNNVAGSNKIESLENAVYLENPELFRFYKALHNDNNVSDKYLLNLWQSVYQASKSNEMSNLLLSHEAITSHFFSVNSQQEKARRIQQLFPDAKILLIVRNQYHWLRSQYTDHPFDPHKLSNGMPMTFDHWVETLLTSEKLAPAREALCYSQLIETYQQLFGSENVHVLLFEDLSQAPHKFYAQLAKYLNVSAEFVHQSLNNKHENRGLSSLYNSVRQWQRANSKDQRWQRVMRWLLTFNSIKKLPKKEYQLTTKVAKMLDGFYQHDNAQLRTILDIDAYNYPGNEK